MAELDEPEASSRLGETEIAQPAIFAIQVALAALWRSWGVVPDAVVGHSVGEIAAAHVAGALSLADAARLVAARGRIMQQATGLGRMASVEVTETEAVEQMVAGASKLLSVAAVNAPRSTVISGDTAALEALLAALSARGIAHRMLPVNYAFHSAQMDPFASELVASLEGFAHGRPSIPMISTVSGAAVDGSALTAEYWGRNIRRAVRFGSAVDTLLAMGVDTIVEVAPHPVLALSIASVCEERGVQATVVASLRRGRPESLTMRSAAATLFANGAALEWEGLFPGGGTRTSLPSYPWQRVRYWQDASLPGSSMRQREAGHPLLGRRVESPALAGPLFESRISPDQPAFLQDHRVAGTVVVPARAFIDIVMAAAGGPSVDRAVTLRDLLLREPLLLADGQEQTVQCITRSFVDGFDFELVSAPTASETGPAQWTTHASGSVSHAARAMPAVMDLAALRQRCTTALDPEALNASHDARGIFFGPSFRGLRQLWHTDAEALGMIVSPDGLSASDAYLVHPGVLDACLQVAFAILPDARDGDALYLPAASDAITMFARTAGSLWSHATLRPSADPATKIVDVEIADEHGALCMRIDGLRLVRSDAERFARQSGRAAECLYRTEWEHAAAPATTRRPVGRWLLLADRGGVAADLAARLAPLGAGVIVATAGDAVVHENDTWTIRADASEDFRRLIEDATGRGALAGIVHLWNLDLDDPIDAGANALNGAALLGTGSVLHLSRALIGMTAAAPPVWLVTQGARAVSAPQPKMNATQAMAWGFARSLAAEQPELRVTCVDLDPAGTADASAILRELGVKRVCGSLRSHGAATLRHVPRLRPLPTRDASPASATGDAVRLVPGVSGLIEDLSLQPLRPAPLGDGDVEIDVEVTGLNFRDVLNALGVSPGAPIQLGGECAGTVRRVGRNVTVPRAGDRVMAFATGSFASRVIVDARRVSRQPAGLTTAQAASIPVAFLTAMYALERLANVQRGERVLVHAGAGGVGMAAIQLALLAGAEVYATAGSAEKRALLTTLGVSHALDSRSLQFADDILRLTRGGGVHVVLNSLAGDFIPASLDVLAPSGRFLEMGKRDIWTTEQVSARRPDISYMPFDLADVATVNPELIAELFAELDRRFDAGALRPLPVSSWPLADAAGAFRTMAQARHVGKIVVVHPTTHASARTRERTTVAPRADGIYMVTGGLGPLGLATARWLVAGGARQLVLIGRHNPDDRARGTIAALRAVGADVRVESVDVTDGDQLTALFASLAREANPVRGVVHAAGVLDDGVALDQSWSRMEGVLAPKMIGASLLAHHARGLPLDFFVCYSSATGIFGSPGQTPYAAANAWLDAACHVLRHRGVPATSVQWGPWRDGGMAAARGAAHAARWTSRGVRPIPDALAFAALELALAAGCPRLESFPSTGDAWVRNSPTARLALSFATWCGSLRLLRAPSRRSCRN